jgi:hypothetical protein
MSDPMSGSVPRCPWCSAPLSIPGAERCLVCDAQLVAPPGLQADIKGVTSLDAEAILRARSEAARPRGGLLSLITGDAEEAASARANQASLAIPSDDVRREILRMEREAQLAAQQAEAMALRADAMAQLGIHADELAAAEAAEAADAARAATSSTVEAGTPADSAAPDAAEADAATVEGKSSAAMADGTVGGVDDEPAPSGQPLDDDSTGVAHT